MFGLILVAVVKHFAQLDLIVQQPPQNFRAVVGIILLQHLIALYELPNFLVYLLYFFLRIFKINYCASIDSFLEIFLTFSHEISGITAGRVPHLRKVRYLMMNTCGNISALDLRFTNQFLTVYIQSAYDRLLIVACRMF